MSERFKPYAAVLVLLIKKDEILLIRRSNTGWADGSYTLPSGHVDEGEPITVAAIRETREEVGVEVVQKDLTFSHVLHRRNNQNGRVYIDFFFTAKKWKGKPIICETDKCDDLQWFALDNLPHNIVPFVKDAIVAYINNKPFSEAGWK